MSNRDIAQLDRTSELQMFSDELKETQPESPTKLIDQAELENQIKSVISTLKH